MGGNPQMITNPNAAGHPMNRQSFKLLAMRIASAVHNGGAKVDFEVLSLPGGTLIAALLWVCASVRGLLHAC
jgi:hypothetical protein